MIALFGVGEIGVKNFHLSVKDGKQIKKLMCG